MSDKENHRDHDHIRSVVPARFLCVRSLGRGVRRSGALCGTGATMPKLPLRTRLRARFDRTMDRGAPALVGWLVFVSALLIVLITAVVEAIDGQHAGGWLHALRDTFLNTID